ncbi:DUF5317 family protein [Cellulosilyticum sp. I15G10I2]|uniref:DUF5317 family protein n=1 Tax=Cellulosilyticum sp. I15G10I2 TaxID=1892843 RepID=UPI00085C908C|nr:DUF5317 family protein [Cellulosilyticum sp. I15G10I2]
MLETLLLAIAVAKMKNYSIKPLFKSWPIYLILAIELVYLAIQISIFRGYYGLIKYTDILETIYLSSYLTLIFKYKQYIGAIAGSACVVMGSILNHIAIAANQGKMPGFPTLSYLTGYVTPEAFAKVGGIHVLGDDSTRLKFLTDIFDLGYAILSVGDVLIRSFVFIIIFGSIKYLNRENIIG